MNIGGKRLTPPNRYVAGTPVSYWLVPAAADRLRLQQQIDALANELKATSFEPHITLHTTHLADAEDPADHLAAVGEKLAPLRLECGGTGHSGMLFKTLFVDFSYQALAPLATALRDRSRQFSSFQLDPHLSLLYASLPSATRQAVAEKLNMRGRMVRFSSLAAVIPGPGQTGFQDIATWQVCARHRLNGDVMISSLGQAQLAQSQERPYTNDAKA